MVARIWVTGIGVVSPLGIGVRATYEAMRRGTRAIRPLTLFDAADYRSQVAATVSDLPLREVVPRGARERWSRTDAMALLAAREALEEAGISAQRCPVDLVVGGTTGGMFETEHLLAELARNPEAEGSERMLSHPLSATADRLGEALGPFSRARTLCSACSGSANALLVAANWLQTGLSERVLAGGADGLCRLTFSGFNALSAVDALPCRPFDRARRGLSLGEGAGFLVLETEDAARARGAVPIVELAGWAAGSEAHHITHPQPNGETAARLMRTACLRAGVRGQDVGYINAHGTGTPLNDAMESAAIRLAFGGHADRVWVSTIKGNIGHTLGAAGAIEAAMTACMIRSSELLPTAGLVDVDPACAVRHVPSGAPAEPWSPAGPRVALSNSFGFGGMDTVILLREPMTEGDASAGPAPESRASSATARPSRAPTAATRSPVRNVEVVITGVASLGQLGLLHGAALLAYLQPRGEGDPRTSIESSFIELDPDRGRRLDRASRMLVSSILRAVEQATGRVDTHLVEAPTVEGRGAFYSELAAVGGGSFGNVEGSAGFMRRVFEKGARMASPSAFPNLVPSSPIAHASVYLGIRQIVFSVADLALTGEAAVSAACELLLAGEARGVVAATHEERSAIVERVLSPLCSPLSGPLAAFERRPVRTEGASAIVLEDARSASRPALARVDLLQSGLGSFRPPLPPPPSSGALVLMNREDPLVTAELATTEWRNEPRAFTAARTGFHESLGGLTVAIAAACVSARVADQVLVFSRAEGRYFSLILTPASAHESRSQ